MRKKGLKKFLVSSVFVLLCVSIYGQQRYFVNYIDQRPICKGSDYLKVLNRFKECGAERAVEVLDSLATNSLEKSLYTNFLFYRNQQVKFLIYLNKDREAARIAINSREIFSQNHDTLHIEYITSYQEQGFVKRRYAKEFSPSLKEMILRRLKLATTMGYSDSLSRENPYVDALSHLVNHVYYNDSDDEFFKWAQKAREHYKKINFYGALAILDRLIYSFFDEIGDFESTIYTALKVNNSILEDLQKKDRAWKEKRAFRSNKHDLIEYAIGEKRYEEMIPMLQHEDSLLKIEDWGDKVFLNIDLLKCYINTQDSVIVRNQIDKCIEMLQHENISLTNKGIAFFNLSIPIEKVDVKLAIELLDSATFYAQSKTKYYERQCSKFITYYNHERYSEAIGICEQVLPRDSLNSALVDFSFTDYGSMFQKNEIMARCYYLLWKEHGKDLHNFKMFEAYSIKALEMYKSIYEYYLNSLEYNLYQFSYNEFVYIFLLESITDGLSFEKINKETVLEAYSMVKTQSIINALGRLEQNSKYESSDLSLEYYHNLNKIQEQKTLLNSMPKGSFREKDAIYFSDLLFQNAYLRHKIKQEKELPKENILLTSNDELSYFRTLQAKLKPNQIILDYMLDNKVDNGFRILVSNDTLDISFFKSDADYGIGRKFLRSIKTGSKDEKLNEELSFLLLKGLKPFLKGKTELIIMPDKWLYRIPFETLSLPYSKKRLIQEYNISYNYSGKIWLSNSERPQLNKKSILAIAPIFSIKNDDTIKSELVLNNNYKRSFVVSPLLKSFQEVSQVQGIFENNHFKNKLLINQEASEQNFYKNYKDYSIIHIATHGLADKKYFERSGLFLSQDIEDEGQDNYLSLGEIYSLNAQPSLVVLSACNTGVGQIEEGEGVMALPRGFIYAGVPNVIASLWKVHDEKTKDLMVAFYKHLLEDKVSYAEALRLAKLDCIKKGFLPLDWAGFVLIGN